MNRSGCTASIVALVFLLWAQTARAESDCAAYTRCSECVYDSGGEFLASERLSCVWCPSEKRCVNAGGNESNCNDGRRRLVSSTSVEGGERRQTEGSEAAASSSSSSTDFVCDDMRCFWARNTANIYLCRGGLQIALFFAVLLLLVTIAYFLWVRCIQQLPWRFQNIHDVIARHVARDGSPVGAALNGGKGENGFEVHCTPYLVGSCPMCRLKHEGRSFAPGEVCYWCGVARLAFFPFAGGLVASTSVIFLLLLTSIRPWFIDQFVIIAILAGFALYAVFFGYVLYFHEVDGNGESTMWFQLTAILLGRSYRSVYESKVDPVVIPTQEEEEMMQHEDSSGTAASAFPPMSPSASTTGIPTMSESAIAPDLHADTAQMLELDRSVPSDFRKRLMDDLKNDEYVLWWEQADTFLLCIDNSWLLALFGHMIVIGIWSFIVGGIPASRYPAILWGPSIMRGAGLVCILFGAVMFAAVFAGCSRLYVMTNKRLFIFTTGLLGSPSVNVQPLARVKSAWVYGYEILQTSVLSFEYEVDDGRTRRLPKLRTKFVGVKNMDLLLKKFHEFAPPIAHNDNLKDELQHLRRVWSLHTVIIAYIAVIIPIVFVYTQLFPPELGVVGMTLAHGLCGCIVTRAHRTQTTTTVPLTVSKAWSKWGAQGFSLLRMFKFSRRGRANKLAQIRESAMKNVQSSRNVTEL